MSNAEPTAVILAAGEGRRLEPLTNRRPKPMLPVVNEPLLEHVVEAVAAAGIDDIVLVVGYERDRIQTHFADGDTCRLSSGISPSPGYTSRHSVSVTERRVRPRDTRPETPRETALRNP